MDKVHHLLAPAITDKGLGNNKGIGVIKENPANVNYKGKCNKNLNINSNTMNKGHHFERP